MLRYAPFTSVPCVLQEDALSSLLDVSSEYLPDMGGFKLTFTFGPNDYFTDAVLTKTFHVPNLVEGKMFELDKAEGR